MQFVASCLSVSAAYERVPMSLEIALYTIFKRSVNHHTAGLLMDPSFTPKQCREFTALMAIKMGLTIKRLVGCFSDMSNRLVCEARDRHADEVSIHELFPLSFRL